MKVNSAPQNLRVTINRECKTHRVARCAKRPPASPRGNETVDIIAVPLRRATTARYESATTVLRISTAA